MKYLILIGALAALSGCGALTNVEPAKKEVVNTKAFDARMIKIQHDMVSKNKNFSVDNITIIKKKKIDDIWKMYTFNLKITDVKTKGKFQTPMIIFTDGKYETNSLTNMATGERYEVIEQQRMKRESKSTQEVQRDAFEKNFTLNSKWYDSEHLLLGKANAKNKVVFISDPLCIACIGSFPRIYDSLKGKKDFALYYYHYPLKGLHPTAEIVSKAMTKAKQDGIRDVELRVYKANLDNYYDVYKIKDNNVALKNFNKIFKTNYKVSDLVSISVSEDMKIGQEVKLRGTPTVVFNGKLKDSRQRLTEALR